MTEVNNQDSSEVFSNAEFYHLRNCLVELVEEVKLRRNNDTESEERIKLLVNEKYKLERTFEGEQGKVLSLLEEHQRQLADTERSFLEKMRLIEEENKQLRIYKKCGEKETDALKDSVRSLQLTKYSLEKNLRDQEHKLQSHLSSSDQQLGEITALEQKLQSMTAHFQHLATSQDKLAKNVSEAMKLNKSLMFVNEHQKCVMEQQKTDLHQCRQQLIQLNTRLESPAPDSGQLEELQQHLATLEHQVDIMKDQKEALQQELDDYRTRHKKSLDELQQTQLLVKQHLENAGHHRDRCDQLELTIVNLRSKVKDTEEQVSKLHQELDVERTLRNEASSKWTQQEECLKVELDEVKKELDSTERAREVLEGLNLKLKEENTSLDEQYHAVKAILNKEKREQDQQTSVSVFQMEACGTQTEKEETCDGSVQTELDTASAGVQAVQSASSSSVQTDQPQYVNSVSQTIVPPLTNISIQTIISTTTDDDFQSQKQGPKTIKDIQEVLVVESSDDTSPEDDEVKQRNEKEALDVSESTAKMPGIEHEEKNLDEKFESVIVVPVDVPSEEVNQCISDKEKQCPNTTIVPTLSDSSSSMTTMTETISSNSLSESRVHFQEQTIQAVRPQLPISKHGQKQGPKKSTELSYETQEFQIQSLKNKIRSEDENVSSAKLDSEVIASSSKKELSEVKPSSSNKGSLAEKSTVNEIGSLEANTQTVKRESIGRIAPVNKRGSLEVYSPSMIKGSLEMNSPSNKLGSLEVNLPSHRKIETLKSRSLYNESPKLWGAHLEAEEPRASISRSTSSKDKAVSISESWAALLTAEEQKKKTAAAGRSPRTRLKIGLKILTESPPSRKSSKAEGSPLRHQKLSKPVISGLENSESDFQEAYKVTGNGVRLQKRNSSGPDSSAESKCLKLQQDPAHIFNPAERKQLKENQIKPGKSILKCPWSQRSLKSVRFNNAKEQESLVTAHVTPRFKSSAQEQPESTSDYTGSTQLQRSGEQLLFSDED